MTAAEQLAEKPFRIYGEGIYSLNQPRYATAKEARDDLWRYAKSVNQSPLLFSVFEDLKDGAHRPV